MTVSLNIRHRARIDLLAHMEFLYERRPDAAARFYQAVRTTYEQLLSHPQLGGLYPWSGDQKQDVRMWMIDGYSNYVVFYAENGTQVDVLRLLGAAQDWQNILND